MKNSGPLMYTTVQLFSFSVSGSPILCQSIVSNEIVIAALFTTKNTQPPIIPITIAILKSKITVQIIVRTNNRIADQYLWTNSSLIVLHSFIRQAVTIKTPASAGIGICDITGAKTSMESNKTTAWIMPANLVCAPDLMATLVRAMAASSRNPAKKRKQ